MGPEGPPGVDGGAADAFHWQDETGNVVCSGTVVCTVFGAFGERWGIDQMTGDAFANVSSEYFEGANCTGVNHVAIGGFMFAQTYSNGTLFLEPGQPWSEPGVPYQSFSVAGTCLDAAGATPVRTALSSDMTVAGPPPVGASGGIFMVPGAP